MSHKYISTASVHVQCSLYLQTKLVQIVSGTFFLPELIELEGLDPGPPRPRPVLAPRPLLPLRAPLSSPLVPRGRCSRSFASSGSEVLDSSEFVTGSGKNRCRLRLSATSKPDLASSKPSSLYSYIHKANLLISLSQLARILGERRRRHLLSPNPECWLLEPLCPLPRGA